MILEVVTALEELKKFLEELNNSMYTFVILMLTDYFHAMEIRQEEEGDGEEGTEEGGMVETTTITILFLSSYLVFYIFILYIIKTHGSESRGQVK